MCLQAWKTFSQILLAEDDDQTLGLYRFRQHVCRPEEELKLYTQPLTSATTDFITHITISGGCLFTGNELLSLADMKNLGVLELIKPADDLLASYPLVNDRLLRGWSDAEDPFPLLRILRIWGDSSVTQVSLRWVAKFPSLAVYDVMGGKDDWASAYEEAAATGWHVSQQVTRVEDSSILRYLMLLSPSEEIPMKRFRNLSRSIDIDLVSLCCDSRCAVKFVNRGDAPVLLNYLTDPAKVSMQHSWDPDAALREVKFCHGIAFEAWAFWLYSLIGQLSDDHDLKIRELVPELQTVAGPFVLPCKPIACLFLGHSGRDGISSKPSYISRGLFATKRFTFTRPDIICGKASMSQGTDEGAAQSPYPSERSQPSVKFNKRRRLEDVLDSFG